MKTKILLFLTVLFVSATTFAKDTSAWKKEETLDQQYQVFKKNLNYWNKSYFMSGNQLDEFYNALSDSVGVLENEIQMRAEKIDELQNDLRSIQQQLADTNTELDASVKSKNSIEVFGLNVEKDVYTLFMSMIILALLIALGILFLLFKRSHTITRKTREDYNGLKEEFEIHKKNSLNRYTKINTELHNARMALNNR